MTFPYLRVGAAVFGLCLLSVQITFAVYSDGPIYTTVATVAAFISLATLPVLAFLAYAKDRVGVAAALMASTVAAMVFTLPTSTGRLAEERERAASQLLIHEQLLHEANEQIAGARVAMETAARRAAEECATGVGVKCRANRAAYGHRERRLNALIAKREDLLADRPVGDVGTDIWAWATGVHADALRKVVAIAAALGLDVSIAALFGFAAHARDSSVNEGDSSPNEANSSANEANSSPKKSVSLGERWLQGFIEENPDATAEQAYSAYKQWLSGRGGKRMALSTFKRRFEKVAA